MKKAYFLMSTDLQDNTNLDQIVLDFETHAEMECVDYVWYDKEDPDHTYCYIAN